MGTEDSLQKAFVIIAKHESRCEEHRIATLMCCDRPRTTIMAVHSRGDFLMCDYSLHHVASRPAKGGDKLVTSAFDSSTTHGFCAVGEPDVAVCLRPGTELAFDNDVKSNHA